MQCQSIVFPKRFSDLGGPTIQSTFGGFSIYHRLLDLSFHQALKREETGPLDVSFATAAGSQLAESCTWPVPSLPGRRNTHTHTPGSGMILAVRNRRPGSDRPFQGPTMHHSSVDPHRWRCGIAGWPARNSSVQCRTETLREHAFALSYFSRATSSWPSKVRA